MRGRRRSSTGPVSLAASFGLAIAVASPAFAQDVGEVLAHVRSATGIGRLAEHPSGVRLEGSRVVAELGHKVADDAPGLPAILLVDAKGRFVWSTRVGEMVLADGFDGRTLWRHEPEGQTHAVYLGDRTTTWLEVGIMTGTLLGSGTPLAFRTDAPHSDDAAVALAFDTDEGRAGGWVRIDRKTWRPTRWEVTVGEKQRMYDLEGSVSFDGMTFPAVIRSRAKLGLSEVVRIRTAKEAPPHPDNAFDFVATRPEDSAFDASLPPDVESRRARSGHVLVRVKMASADAGWFVFDTGCPQTVIAPAVARKLGLKPGKNLGQSGVGPGVAASMLCFPETLTAGPLTIRNPECRIGDTAIVDRTVDEQISGVVGQDILDRSIAEIDLAAGKVRLYPPGCRSAPGEKWTSLVFREGAPCVPATFEGNRGLFMLDTGGASTLVMSAPTVARLKMLEGRETAAGTVGGIGGPAQTRQGRLASFALAGRDFGSIRGYFATAKNGSFADPYLDGIIGVGILKEFVIVLDHQRTRVSFVARDKGAASEPEK